MFLATNLLQHSLPVFTKQTGLAPSWVTDRRWSWMHRRRDRCIQRRMGRHNNKQTRISLSRPQNRKLCLQLKSEILFCPPTGEQVLEFSTCTEDCGGGETTAVIRMCNDKTVNGGEPCDTITMNCNSQLCDSKWTIVTYRVSDL